jgi:hypothetical protein
MNTLLYNELIEAKGNGTLGTVLQEKFASLDIKTEEELQYLFDCVNEKTAMMMGASEPGFVAKSAKKVRGGVGDFARETLKNTKGNSLTKVLAALAIGGVAAVPMGRMIANAANKKSTYDKVLSSNPDLKNHPKTKDHYDMLWHVAPNLASNHVIANSVLEQLKAYEMIDHQMIAKLVEADKNMAESRNKSGIIANAKDLADVGKNLSDISQKL